MPSFVLVDALGALGQELALPAEAAHHVVRVCRSRAGDRITATDGRGAVAELELLEVGREVRARIERAERQTLSRRATLWCGAPEGERADWLIEKLVELGVTRFQPLDTERSSWRSAAARTARWQRLAAAALRQSRQAWLMEILPARGLDELLGQGVATDSRWLADPEGDRAPVAPPGAETLGVIGPAEGLTPAERASLVTCGFLPISLAGGRLRCETAALAWAAWWAGARER
ncbi:MAG: RsmE family RNA methyltransferase [Candidatus Eiseniibacteriota bacterium]